MPWSTSVWVMAALVVATSALHLTIEHDVLSNLGDGQTKDQTFGKDAHSSTVSGQQKDVIHIINGSEEYVVTKENYDEEIEAVSAENHSLANSKEQAGPNKFTENPMRSNEVDVVKIEPQNPDLKENGDNNGDGGGGDNEGGYESNNDPREDDAAEDHMIIQTTTGQVRGNVWRENANIISYIDMKYGAFSSPFESPISPAKSESIHEVKDHSKRCPQLEGEEYVGDTDCLTLSIFKPAIVENASVLVHIHEANFNHGSGNPAIYGPEYLVSKGIILVLPNYRLGPLGFLCLQNETAPGNAALKDLTLALKWIKDNIAAFGGNPNNIAVSGDGTSGALAGYLALSPMSKDYVSKVITESGSILSHWALDRTPIVTATNLVRSIPGFRSWTEVETLDVLKAAKDFALRPCLENKNNSEEYFMVRTPWNMVHSQEINISFIMGSAMYAGVHNYIKLSESAIQQLNQNVRLLLPDDLQFSSSAEKISVGNKVKAQYFGENAINPTDVEQLSLYFTDAAYLGPSIRIARPLVDSGATVYFYEFSFVGDLNRELELLQCPVTGAVKGDIVGYLFTQDGRVPGEDTKESRMVEQLTDLWTTFLKTGNPTATNIVWNKLDKAQDSEEEWLSIKTETKLEKGLHVDRLRLWTDIYNEHFIERSLAFQTSPGVYTVLALQFVFLISFFRNVSHFY